MAQLLDGLDVVYAAEEPAESSSADDSDDDSDASLGSGGAAAARAAAVARGGAAAPRRRRSSPRTVSRACGARGSRRASSAPPWRCATNRARRGASRSRRCARRRARPASRPATCSWPSTGSRCRAAPRPRSCRTSCGRTPSTRSRPSTRSSGGRARARARPAAARNQISDAPRHPRRWSAWELWLICVHCGAGAAGVTWARVAFPGRAALDGAFAAAAVGGRAARLHVRPGDVLVGLNHEPVPRRHAAAALLQRFSSAAARGALTLNLWRCHDADVLDEIRRQCAAAEARSLAVDPSVAARLPRPPGRPAAADALPSATAVSCACVCLEASSRSRIFPPARTYPVSTKRSRDHDVHGHGRERDGDVGRRALADARGPPAEAPHARPPPVGLRVREVLGRQVAVEDRRPQRAQVRGRAHEEEQHDDQRREVEDRRHLCADLGNVLWGARCGGWLLAGAAPSWGAHGGAAPSVSYSDRATRRDTNHKM